MALRQVRLAVSKHPRIQVRFARSRRREWVATQPIAFSLLGEAVCDRVGHEPADGVRAVGLSAVSVDDAVSDLVSDRDRDARNDRTQRRARWLGDRSGAGTSSAFW